MEATELQQEIREARAGLARCTATGDRAGFAAWNRLLVELNAERRAEILAAAPAPNVVMGRWSNDA